jgi:hypothetical protein
MIAFPATVSDQTLAELARDFPFDCELSLGPLIGYWTDGARENSLRGGLGRVLQAELARAPELSEPIVDLTVLDRHRELVEALMAAIFPTVFWDQEHAAALIPFQLKSFYSTPAFARNLMAADGKLSGRLNVDSETLLQFRLLNAYSLVLGRVYGVQLPLDYPLIFTVEDRDTGLDRHFKIHFDGRFVDVQALRAPLPLTPAVRERLAAGTADLATLGTLVPPGSYRFRGFTVFRALDVTDQEVLSSLKRDLIDKESIISHTRFQELEVKLRTSSAGPRCASGWPPSRASTSSRCIRARGSNTRASTPTLSTTRSRTSPAPSICAPASRAARSSSRISRRIPTAPRSRRRCSRVVCATS